MWLSLPVVPALLFAFTAICDPGDENLAPTPFYTNYNGFATIAGASIAPIPTSIETNFALPSDTELDQIKTDRTRAFVFSILVIQQEQYTRIEEHRTIGPMVPS